MNRNTELHFSEIPSVEIGRSKFDRGHTRWGTMDSGRLYPIYVDTTIMPGDTVKMRTSELVRMMTPIAPVMDDCFLDTYFFFIPYRLVWPHFKRMMGENDTAPWAQNGNYEVPQITFSGEDSPAKPKSLADYMGYAITSETEQSYYATPESDPIPYYQEYEASALPFRAYGLIWNEFFRDENLQNPVNVHTDDTDRTCVGYNDTESLDDYVSDTEFGGLRPLKVCKVPDYFTTCLPAPQKGPAVTMPLAGTAPIKLGKQYSSNKWSNGTYTNYYAGIEQQNSEYYSKAYKMDTPEGTPSSLSGSVPWHPYQLLADLSNATGSTINALRQAFAVQKFYERQARSGTRFTEIIKGHFDVTNPDFRMQRPEYLGGHRTLINMNQVVQTVGDATTPLGNTGAYSVTLNQEEDLFTHSFTEWGILMGVACIRQKHSYSQGLNRQFSMKKMTDWYWPEFANLGECAVLNKEIYMMGNAGSDSIPDFDNQAFGYQEAWAHYRYFPDLQVGEMRTDYPQSLGDVWTYGDSYEETPKLGDKWIQEDKSNIDRTLAVQNHDQFMFNIYFGAIYTRPMPLYSIPGLIDHH